jgi:hypothetical protein
MQEQFHYRRGVYARGEYPAGHGVRCKYCEQSFEKHALPVEPGARKVRKGFRISLEACLRKGYAPRDLNKWHRFEKSKQKEDHWTFIRQVYERRAQGEAAWGRYAAGVRQKNYDREHRTLTDQLSRARDGSERGKAQASLDDFHKRTKSQASILYVGSGAGPGLAEYD